MYKLIIFIVSVLFSSREIHAASPHDPDIHSTPYLLPEILQLKGDIVDSTNAHPTKEDLRLINFAQTLMQEANQEGVPNLLLAVDSILQSFLLGNNNAISLLQSFLFSRPVISAVINNFFGMCFALGRRVEKDSEKALRCFQNSAHLGNDQAVINLLIMSKSNNFINYSEENLMKLIEQIRQGDREALYWLVKLTPELITMRRDARNILGSLATFCDRVNKVSGTFYEMCAYNYEPGIINLFKPDRHLDMLVEANRTHQNTDDILHPWIKACFRSYYERTSCLHSEQIDGLKQKRDESREKQRLIEKR